jgi:hypothetical protein
MGSTPASSAAIGSPAYQPPDHPIPPNTREISKEAAGALMRAGEHHASRRRFGRVHLAAETLTPVLRASVLAEHDNDETLCMPRSAYRRMRPTRSECSQAASVCSSQPRAHPLGQLYEPSHTHSITRSQSSPRRSRQQSLATNEHRSQQPFEALERPLVAILRGATSGKRHRPASLKRRFDLLRDLGRVGST